MIHGDDTGVKLHVVGSNRTKKAHLWVCIGDADYPYVLFDFTANHTAEGPTQFLAGYEGYFQADALAQYEGLYGEDKAKHVCCSASNSRRRFFPSEIETLAPGVHRARSLAVFPTVSSVKL